MTEIHIEFCFSIVLGLHPNPTPLSKQNNHTSVLTLSNSNMGGGHGAEQFCLQ
jgi:hypothetical protein